MSSDPKFPPMPTFVPDPAAKNPSSLGGKWTVSTVGGPPLAVVNWQERAEQAERRVKELEAAAKEAIETGPCHSECFTSLGALEAAMGAVARGPETWAVGDVVRIRPVPSVDESYYGFVGPITRVGESGLSVEVDVHEFRGWFSVESIERVPAPPAEAHESPGATSAAGAGPTSLGFYRHYKGGLYEALMLASLSEDRCRSVVVYRSLETGKVWVRPLHHDGHVDAWDDKVRWPDGVVRARFVPKPPTATSAHAETGSPEARNGTPTRETSAKDPPLDRHEHGASKRSIADSMPTIHHRDALTVGGEAACGEITAHTSANLNRISCAQCLLAIARKMSVESQHGESAPAETPDAISRSGWNAAIERACEELEHREVDPQTHSYVAALHLTPGAEPPPNGLRNARDHYKDLWEKNCTAVSELCDLAGAKPDDMHDVWTLKLLIEEQAQRRKSARSEADATLIKALVLRIHGMTQPAPAHVSFTVNELARAAQCSLETQDDGHRLSVHVRRDT